MTGLRWAMKIGYLISEVDLKNTVVNEMNIRYKSLGHKYYSLRFFGEIKHYSQCLIISLKRI